MNTQEPIVVITLKEYNELIAIKTKFVAAFKKKQTILDVYLEPRATAGWSVGYNIVNESDLINELACRIKELEEKKHNLYKELHELK
jgi:hypothetical protein